MISTLVVPLDGSELAERALPCAVQLARASHARLVLMQAAHAPLSASLQESDWEPARLDAVAVARTYLTRIAESLSGQVDAVTTVVACGRPTDKILETIDAFRADGVVMTTHGRTGFDHLLHGSVTEALLARSKVPVFVVYAQPGQAAAPPFSPFSARLLVPQNGSDYDAPALRAAVEMLGPRGEIVLVTVVAPPAHVVLDESSRHVLAYLDQQEEAQADLIVMATHGRTGLQRAMLGSVAGEVLRTACTPVVLVHPNVPSPPDAGIEDPLAEEFGPVPTF